MYWTVLLFVILPNKVACYIVYTHSDAFIHIWTVVLVISRGTLNEIVRIKQLSRLFLENIVNVFKKSSNPHEY